MSNSDSFLIPHSSSGRGVLGNVHLGALQLAAVVHVDRLPLGEHVQPGLARLAVAVAGAARAAEGQLDLGSNGARVDVDDAGGDVAHGAEYLVHVGGVDRAGQAVLGVIVHVDGLLQAVHR